LNVIQYLDSSSSVGKAKHIFISYNHGSKPTVLRLRDQLKAAGFMVWVDDEGVCTYMSSQAVRLSFFDIALFFFIFLPVELIQSLLKIGL